MKRDLNNTPGGAGLARRAPRAGVWIRRAAILLTLGMLAVNAYTWFAWKVSFEVRRAFQEAIGQRQNGARASSDTILVSLRDASPNSDQAKCVLALGERPRLPESSYWRCRMAGSATRGITPAPAIRIGAVDSLNRYWLPGCEAARHHGATRAVLWPTEPDPGTGGRQAEESGLSLCVSHEEPTHRRPR